MPATIDIDIIDGAQATAHVIQGAEVEVLATVTDLAGTDSGTLFTNALVALASMSPPRKLGTACPGIMQPNFLQSITPVSVGGGACKCRLNYRGFPALQIEIGTCLSSTDSNIDHHADIDEPAKAPHTIFVEYQFPSSYIAEHPDTVIDSNGRTPQGGTVQRAIQETTLTLKFTVVGVQQSSAGGFTQNALGGILDLDTSVFENSGADTDGVDNGATHLSSSGFINAGTLVLTFAQSYVGTVNEAIWTSAPGAARTWLCENVRGISRDGGLTYEMSVTFHYRRDTWDFLIWFVDPITGKPPRDLVNNIGMKKIREYSEGTLPVMPPPGYGGVLL